MRTVDPKEWHNAVSASIADGYAQFVTLMGIDDDGVQVWLRLRNDQAEDLVLAADASRGLDTLIDLLPDCTWYEREAAEMFGIRFHGHDTQPLLRPAGSPPWMLKSQLLEPRNTTPWPGEKDPGGATPRRRSLPPGVRP